jgi:DNA processing protein
VHSAQDQGRDVLVVPGPITSPVSAGTNNLLREGAGPLLELRDLLDHYPELEARKADSPMVRESRAMVDRMLAALTREPLAAEVLVERIGAPVEVAMEALSVLELRGKVRRESGLYRAVADGLFV